MERSRKHGNIWAKILFMATEYHFIWEPRDKYATLKVLSSKRKRKKKTLFWLVNQGEKLFSMAESRLGMYPEYRIIVWLIIYEPRIFRPFFFVGHKAKVRTNLTLASHNFELKWSWYDLVLLPQPGCGSKVLFVPLQFLCEKGAQLYFCTCTGLSLNYEPVQ